MKKIAFGEFEDYIVFKSMKKNNEFIIHEPIFFELMNKLYDVYWVEKKINYVQVLKEWNEDIGFYGLDEKPSVINDLEEFIEALKFVELKYTEKENLINLIDFLSKYKNEGLKIFRI
ncbi:hypothetical protein [Aureivirga sp. CE67]|uniref:hypothetical protein n=1 Tax=Aureivirga sp. CE67 TaxID=1788983 RepID=UPI0018C9C76C|nr:hypothetical protein [Aureivirga sp. CE67]